VVNTSAEPVPTTVQGTTTVTGGVNVTNTPTVGLSPAANGVQAQQSGVWNVGISGTPAVTVTNTPTVGLSPSANTVQAQQGGTWNVGIDGTPNVNIINTPTVGLSLAANSVQAQQSGAWNVSISGTPTVSLTSGSSVGITGTPNVSLAPGTSVQISNPLTNPIPVQNVGGVSAPTTLLFNSGTVSITNAPGSTNFGDFDASAYSRIRVVASSNCGFTNNVTLEDLRVRVVVVESGQAVQPIDELKPCGNFPLGGTRIIELPGATLRITVLQGFTYNVPQSVQVVVYGR
jgi:hypothetical protein